MIDHISQLRARLAGFLAARNEGKRTGRESGAVAVEMAVVALVLVPLACGIIDFGILIQHNQTLETGVRVGARTASKPCSEATPSCDNGNRPDDDFRVLEALNGALRNANNEVERVVIYNVPGGSAPVDASPPAACAAGTAITDVCNVYTTSDLSKPASYFTCTTGPASVWKACDRKRKPGDAGYVGVWVRLRHKWVTGLFGTARTLSDQAVFRLDPLPSPPQRIKNYPPPIPAPTTTTTTLPAPPPPPPTLPAPPTAPSPVTAPAPPAPPPPPPPAGPTTTNPPLGGGF
jgi:TadE-like protein